MITYQNMKQEQVDLLKQIDRSETIDLIYQINDGNLIEVEAGHDCPNWNADVLSEIQERYQFELNNGGFAIGAFAGDQLVGFGVLAHRFRGNNKDRLQIDLMYVSRPFRRQGVGREIFSRLEQEAKRRGAKYLYISSTETRSAVSFYKCNGSRLAEEVDEELYRKEPLDIHMMKEI